MDELVASAVAHWGPRFTTNGVTTADFARSRGHRALGRLVPAWTAEGSAHEALGRAALAEGRTRSAGEHLARAAVYHHFAKFVFVTDPARCAPRTSGRSPASPTRCRTSTRRAAG